MRPNVLVVYRCFALGDSKVVYRDTTCSKANRMYSRFCHLGVQPPSKHVFAVHMTTVLQLDGVATNLMPLLAKFAHICISGKLASTPLSLQRAQRISSEITEAAN